MFSPFAFRSIKVEAGGGGGIDPDAQAFLTATGITDPTITSAIDGLVVDLKNAGLWTKSNAIYPFVGGTADTHKYNLIDPQNTDAAFRLGFLGGMTHNSNGITGNGTSNFATTYLQANGELAGGSGRSQNDFHMLYYARTTSARGGVDIGAYATAQNTALAINSRNASNLFNTAGMTANVYDGVSNTATTGFYGVTRDGTSTTYRRFQNTTKTTVTRNSSTPPTRDIFIMAINNDGTAASFQNRNIALVSLGYGLSDTEIDDWVTINQTFQTALGRFV